MIQLLYRQQYKRIRNLLNSINQYVDHHPIHICGKFENKFKLKNYKQNRKLK